MMTSSKELLTSIHRHYNNSFTDNEKQFCLNLFLGIYQPSKHPRLHELDCDSWVHHKVLRDDYTPQEWWKAPLQRHADNIAILQREELNSDEEPAMLSKTKSLEDATSWFRQVHKVWKFTWFENLLSRLEATCVQINASSRKLSTVRPYKMILPRLKPKPLALLDAKPGPCESWAAGLAACDEQVYRSYADPRQLNQLMWTKSPTDAGNIVQDLSSAVLPLVKGAEVFFESRGSFASRRDETSAPSLLEELGMLLHGKILQHLQRERPRHRPRTNNNDRSPEVATGSTLRAIREGYEQNSALLGRGPPLRDPPIKMIRSVSEDAVDRRSGSRGAGPGGLGLAEMSSPPRFSSPPTRRSPPMMPAAAVGRSSRQAHVRWHLCSYCDEPYDAATEGDLGAEGRRLEAGRHLAQRNQLCPRHRSRAEELERFRLHGSIEVPLGGASSGSREERRCRPVLVSAPAPGRSAAGSCRPWANWLRVERPRRPQAEGHHLYSRVRASSKSWQLGMDEMGHHVAGRTSTAMICGDAPTASGRDGKVVSPSRQASSSVPEASAARRAADGPGSGGAAPAAASADNAELGNDPLLLWSYAFPHAAPPAPAEGDELGLPRWWLQSMKAAPAPSQETLFASLPLARSLGAKSSASSKVRRPAPAHRFSVAGHQRTTSSSSRISGAPSSSPKAQEPWPPATGNRSIFDGASASQVLEEISQLGELLL